MVMMIIIIFSLFWGWLKLQYIYWYGNHQWQRQTQIQKRNENVFSVVAKRWPIQRSQVVELLIHEFTQLWIFVIKIRFPCTNPLSFPKAAEANIKSRWRFHLNWWPVWKSSSYKRIFSASSSGKKLECTMGEYCRLTQWCHHLKSNFCTKKR